MVRQRPRKSVEELYATKFEANPLKSIVNNAAGNHSQSQAHGHGHSHSHSHGISKTVRPSDRDYSGYIISSNTPYNTTAGGGGASAGHAPSASTGMATNRRKSARPSSYATSMKPDKFFGKEEKLHGADDAKKDHCMKIKTARPDKSTYNNVTMSSAMSSAIYDNKNFVNFVECTPKELHASSSQHQPQPQHHRHQPPLLSHDDEKDDDTEEFFELIRQTVENAIGKSISDLLNRNFRELSSKVDRFSTELKATNQLLNKLQAEMSNKVVHYGEENSRHFRYLCMKSEYDKMFYQHHTMLATTPSASSPAQQSDSHFQSASPSPSPIPKPPPKPQAQPASTSAASGARPSPPKASPTVDCDKVQSPCTCRPSNSALSATEPHKSSSEEHSMSNKSSEMGMREVLEHIQRFCTQMQLNDLKCDEPAQSEMPMPMPPMPPMPMAMPMPMPKPKPSNYHRLEEAMKINKQVFDEDDDDFQMSSDGMTPRSDEHLPKYACTTTRGNNGGGDA